MHPIPGIVVGGGYRRRAEEEEEERLREAEKMTCPVCGVSLANKQNLKKHLRKVHGVDEAATWRNQAGGSVVVIPFDFSLEDTTHEHPGGDARPGLPNGKEKEEVISAMKKIWL